MRSRAAVDFVIEGVSTVRQHTTIGSMPSPAIWWSALCAKIQALPTWRQAVPTPVDPDITSNVVSAAKTGNTRTDVGRDAVSLRGQSDAGMRLQKGRWRADHQVANSRLRQRWHLVYRCGGARQSPSVGKTTWWACWTAFHKEMGGGTAIQRNVLIRKSCFDADRTPGAVSESDVRVPQLCSRLT